MLIIIAAMVYVASGHFFTSATHGVGVPASPIFTNCQSFNRITHQRGMPSRYRDYATGWTKDRGTWFDSWWEGERHSSAKGPGLLW